VKKSEHISPKSHNKPTTLNGVNTQKTTIIWAMSAVKTWELT
jgi:hypothetical protein